MSEYKGHPKSKTMDCVLDVRYTDLEREKTLCLELMAWAEDTKDLYGEAFGNTYLGDYYVAQNDGVRARKHLLKASALIDAAKEEYEELSLRLLSLLAICFEMQADEQAAIRYYMNAIVLAKRLEDHVSECLIYNNLATAFQRHSSSEEALHYFTLAYSLAQGTGDIELESVLLSNLSELLVFMGRMEEALEHINRCSKLLEEYPEKKEEHDIRNWCIYYGAAGNKEAAIKWAEKALHRAQYYEKFRFLAFENYASFFRAMMQVGSQKHAKAFLDMMAEVGKNGGLDQQIDLEKKRVEFSLKFANKESYLEVYRRFYEKTRALREDANTVIVNAMRGKITLEQALMQREKLLFEQANLTHQADRDELSQLYSRGYLERLLREWDWDSAGESMGVIMLDIDYFKEYNDFYGHLEGDNVIHEVGESLLKYSRKGIYSCRYGGDEFACILENADEAVVEDFIQRVRTDLQEKSISHEKSLCSSIVTLSIGYAAGRRQENVKPYYLMELADKALYTTKLSGRNGFSRKRMSDL